MHLDNEAAAISIDAEMATSATSATGATIECESQIALEDVQKASIMHNTVDVEPTSPASFMMDDPFLALHNDLEDVSEVIKHNLVTDEQQMVSVEGAIINASPSPEPAALVGGGISKVELLENNSLTMTMSSPPTRGATRKFSAIHHHHGQQHQHQRDSSLPLEFMEEHIEGTGADDLEGRERQIGHIMDQLLQQPAAVAQQQQQQQQQQEQQNYHNFEDAHFQLSPMAAATNSPESLLMMQYSHHQQPQNPFGQQMALQADPLVGGEGGIGMMVINSPGSSSQASSANANAHSRQQQLHFLQRAAQQKGSSSYNGANGGSSSSMLGSPDSEEGGCGFYLNGHGQHQQQQHFQFPSPMDEQHQHWPPSGQMLIAANGTGYNSDGTDGNFYATTAGPFPLAHQMSIEEEEESPPPMEPNFVATNGIKQEMLLMSAGGMNCNNPMEAAQQPQEHPAVAAKNELIRMLLEMSPEELEQLRASRTPRRTTSSNHQQGGYNHNNSHHRNGQNANNQQHHQIQQVQQQHQIVAYPSVTAHPTHQPIFIQTTNGGPQQPMFLQSQPLQPPQLQQQQSPPLDPPPPLSASQLAHFQQMEFVPQQLQQQQQQRFGHQILPINGQQQFVDYANVGVQMQLTHQQQFYPSPTGSASINSPVEGVGGFPSLAPSEMLEDESAMEEIWTDDGEMTPMGGNGEENSSGGGTEEGGGDEGQMMLNQQRSGPGRRRGHKTERRTAHNLIEKKYRCSINDRINQLKEMLATEEQTKLSKSATLRRAVDHIHTLRTRNSDLQNENVRLRKTLENAGISPPPHQNMHRLKQEPGGTTAQNGCTNKNARARTMSSRKPTIASSNAKAAAAAGPRDQSRVTLCVFMFLLLAFNPLAIFLASTGAGSEGQAESTTALFDQHHRTLAGDDQYNTAQFAQDPALIPSIAAGRTTDNPQSSSNANANVGTSIWWPICPPWLRHLLVWLLNALFVFAILNRLLVSSEPVADRHSPRWVAFVQSRRKAAHAVAASNWKEAQRQLDESLQLLERPLPSSGGLDEWMSLTWQIIRHLLNVLWIGRWFARRRRPSVQSQKSICRSHAATAMVYHQLHQLHLLGVDGIGLNQGGALNLALLAANLAESAGSSAISHALRAEIYACAGLRSRLCMPRWLRRIISGYFFRRAKRHVSKSQRLEGTELNSLQWLFHPLARKFLAEPKRVAEILGGTGAQRIPNFPFSGSPQSPKPIEVLRDAFKMHLLNGLLVQLDSAEGHFRVTDFVEQSQLLLQICMADNRGGGGGGGGKAARNHAELSGSSSSGGSDDDKQNYEHALFDLLSPSAGAGAGDELCNWWAHLLSGALHWRHGDLARARQHCAVVRKCPKELGQNDLALAVGLAFCSRKICLEDRRKGAWAEMVLLHIQRAFAYLRRTDRHCQWREGEQHGQGTQPIQRHFRLLACQWLLSSLLDLCSFSIGPGQDVPLEVRRLYTQILVRMEREESSGVEGIGPKKLTMFKHLGETLCGIGFLQQQQQQACQFERIRSPSSPAPSSVLSPSPTPSIGTTSTISTMPEQKQRRTTIELLRGREADKVEY